MPPLSFYGTDYILISHSMQAPAYYFHPLNHPPFSAPVAPQLFHRTPSQKLNFLIFNQIQREKFERDTTKLPPNYHLARAGQTTNSVAIPRPGR